jgi:hypothetical protein
LSALTPIATRMVHLHERREVPIPDSRAAKQSRSFQRQHSCDCRASNAMCFTHPAFLIDTPRNQYLSSLYHPLSLSSSYCLGLSSYDELGTFVECRSDFARWVALSNNTDRFCGSAMAVLDATANAMAAAIMEICFIIGDSLLSFDHLVGASEEYGCHREGRN